jgi:hypothetical protein
MGSRRALKGGAPRLLDHHGGTEGKAYRRAFDALDAEFGPLTPLGCLEAGRTAAAYLQLQTTTRALVGAQRKRRLARGRTLNPKDLERLARRQGLADASYSQALDKLRELTAPAKRRTTTPEDLVARLRAGDAANGGGSARRNVSTTAALSNTAAKNMGDVSSEAVGE